MKEKYQEPGYDTCDFCGGCFPVKGLVTVNKEHADSVYPGYGGDEVCKECAIGQPEWYTEKHANRVRGRR